MKLALIAQMLGWFLYCSINSRIGSSIFSKFTERFSDCRILKFETTLIKQPLNVLTFSSFWSKIQSFSTYGIYLKSELLSVKSRWFFIAKWRFIYFQKDLLLTNFLTSGLVTRNNFFIYSKPLCLQKIVSLRTSLLT